MKTGVEVNFADPHCPWQRDINENTKGLLRQYFPIGANLGMLSQEQLEEVALQHNTRLSKSMDFKCPAQMLTLDAFDFKKHHASLFVLPF